MHIFTHLKKESEGVTGLGIYPDGMVEHDGHVGKLLDKLDELGIADNTIVDVLDRQRRRGDELAGRRHDAVPRREGHELRGRLARAVRDSLARRDQAGNRVQRRLLAHRHARRRWLAAAGEPDAVEKLKKGHKSGNKTFKVHIDGYNLLPFLKGEVKENPRKGFLYWSDDGDLMALRVGNWKCTFMEQRGSRVGQYGRSRWSRCGSRTFITCESDPFERASEDATMFYGKWMVDRAFLLGSGAGDRRPIPADVQDFPPRQRPASFSIDQALEKARQTQQCHGHERWCGGEVARRCRLNSPPRRTRRTRVNAVIFPGVLRVLSRWRA